MNFFEIDWDLLIKRLLPTRKRDQWHIDWLLTITKGVRFVYDSFLTFRSDTLRVLSYNSQKLLFEKAINDDCDPAQNRIFIDNAVDDLEESYCYFLSENQEDAFCYTLAEQPFSGRYTYFINEYKFPIDFTIYVPTALQNATEKIKAIANFYKLAGKRYIIKYF